MFEIYSLLRFVKPDDCIKLIKRCGVSIAHKNRQAPASRWLRGWGNQFHMEVYESLQGKAFAGELLKAMVDHPVHIT